jgi:CheY-like chemotaxis protein
MERNSLSPSESPSERTVLVVEDEAMTMRFYLTGLKGLQVHGWRILPAENGARAAEILRQESVDVLVTDLNMPIMDGYRLIALVHDHYPTLPVIVLTSLPPGEPMDKALRLGALRAMSKPVRLSHLMEEIRQAGEMHPEGLVRGLPLASLIQLMNWEGKTCTLKVRSGQLHGHLYVRAGQLIHAQFADEEGLAAAQEILCWTKPSVEFVETCRVEATIDMPVSEILLNTAIGMDETQRQDATAPAPPPNPDDPWALIDF